MMRYEIIGNRIIRLIYCKRCNADVIVRKGAGNSGLCRVCRRKKH